MDIQCRIDGDNAYSDKLTEIYSAGLSRLGGRLVNGELSIGEWHQQMIEAITKMYAFQAMSGVNGEQNRVDMDAVRQAIGDQLIYLDNFANDIEQAAKNGKSIGFVPNRATLYARSSQAQYWRQAVGGQVPHVPKDGSTPCMSNCSCSISVECEVTSGKTTALLVTWNLDPTKEEVHCNICPERAREWSPLRIPVRAA